MNDSIRYAQYTWRGVRSQIAAAPPKSGWAWLRKGEQSMTPKYIYVPTLAAALLLSQSTQQNAEALTAPGGSIGETSNSMLTPAHWYHWWRGLAQVLRLARLLRPWLAWPLPRRGLRRRLAPAFRRLGRLVVAGVIGRDMAVVGIIEPCGLSRGSKGC